MRKICLRNVMKPPSFWIACVVAVVLALAVSFHYLVFRFFTNNIVLSIWIILNIFLILGQFLVVTHRQRMCRSYCLNPYNGFWSTKDKVPYTKEFWLEGITDYACTTDSRLMNPSSIVYVLCTVHILIVIGIVISIAIRNNKITNGLLIIQFINTMLYIITLVIHAIKTKSFQWNVKNVTYWSLPFIWVIIPCSIIVFSSFFRQIESSLD